jgi:hypothetical protein
LTWDVLGTADRDTSRGGTVPTIERWNEVMRWLPTVGRSRRRPPPQSPHRRVRRTRIGYSVRMAWIGSTDAARWAGVKLATIATSVSSAQAMTIVVGSNAETP